MTQLPKDHELVIIWDFLIDVIANCKDPNDKAVIVQNAISEFGPVPNSMGDAVKKAMTS